MTFWAMAIVIHWKGIPLKFFKGSFRSPEFKLILFSWLVAFIAALTITPSYPLSDDFAFLKEEDHPLIQPAYTLFSSLLSTQQEQFDETTTLEKITSPFVVLSLKTSSVEENINSRGYGMIEAYLNEIEGSKEPYFVEKAKILRLLSRYNTAQYEQFIAASSQLDPLPKNLIAPLVHALILTKRNSEAQILFGQHFNTVSMNTWSSTIQSPALNVLVRGLAEPVWQTRLNQLQRTEQLSELNTLLRLRSSPERSLLLDATSLYSQKEYSRSLQVLERIKTPSLLPWKEYLRLKIDARQGRLEELTVRSKQHRGNKAIYLILLADLGGILISQSNDAPGLEFYARYLDEVEALFGALPSHPKERLWHLLPLSEHQELYWQILYRSAWLNYKMDRRDAHRALLKKCLASPINGIRQSAEMWLADNNDEIHHRLTPFGYDYARLQGPLDQRFLRSFLDRIAGPLPLTAAETAQLTDLNRYGLLREAGDYCRWLRGRYSSSPQARNTLAICETILQARQGRYPQAFNVFKEAFPDYSSFLLPRFLAFLVLPLDHQQIISREASQNSLDTLLVTSLIRQESFFMPNAASPANAYGLMQLLLRTAQEVSTAPGRITVQDLQRPTTNIALGCRYLKKMLDRYQGQTHLALAAYNAGPERVDLWLSQLGKISPEEFIELIPFSETRMYVKNILRNMYFYRYYYPDVFPSAQN